MSKRIVCALLTLVLLIGLVPMGAMKASAATPVKEELVTLVTELVPFKSDAYEVGKKTGVYKIGYGTPAKKNQKNMSKTEGKNVLREYLNSIAGTVESGITRTLAQNELDALTSYSYHNGTEWLKGSVLKTMVEKNDKDLALEVLCAGSLATKEQLNIRLCEANLYVNGEYSAKAPSNYAYVILDPNEGKSSAEGAAQGYDKTSAKTIDEKFAPSRKDYTFTGWYTHEVGGKYVTTLDSSTNGRTLYAHWQKNGEGVDKDGNIVGVKVSYKLPASMADVSGYDSLNRIIVYKNPDTKIQVGTLETTDIVDVVAEYTSPATKEKWVRIKDSGWVNLGLHPFSVEAGVVELGEKLRLDIHKVEKGKDPGSTAVVGAIRNGDKVSILERQTIGTKEWGRTVFFDEKTNSYKDGWIDMSFIKLAGTANGGSGSSHKDPKPGIKAKVFDTDLVNVRADGDISSKVIKRIPRNTEVNITEKKTTRNMLWAKTEYGWISMRYLQEIESSDDSSEGSSANGTPIAYGIVNSSINLNVRTGAGTNHTKVSSLPTGTKIPIYEKKQVGGHTWGRTDRGWVCLSFVTETKVTPEGKPDTTGAQKGRVTSPTGVNVRTGAGVHNAPVGRAPYNSEVTVYEIVEYNGAKWGRIDNGFACMDYIELLGAVAPDAGGSNNSDTTTGVRTGAVANTAEVNIRKGPGVKNTEIMKLKKGTRVNVYETTTVDQALWGRIDQGWVSMQYIQLDNNTPNTNPGGNGGTPAVPSGRSQYATGYVNSATNLTIRTGPDINSKAAGSLATGTRVTLYEQTYNGGMMWGKIDQGWVYMGYITIDSTGTTGKGQQGIANCNRTLKVRTAPGTGSAWISNIETNAPVEILEQKEHSGEMWGRTSVGWVSMKYITLNADLPTPPIPETKPAEKPEAKPEQKPSDEGVPFEIAGTVQNATPLRMVPDKMGDYSVSLDKDDAIKISKLENADGILWGHVEGGWINVADVSFNVYAVANKAQMIWQEANTNTAIATLNKGETVNIQGLKLDENNKVWAKVATGWIELTDVTEPDSYTPSFMVKAVTNKADVAIRKTPSAEGEKAGENLAKDSSVVIIALQKDDDGNLWAKSDKGWWIPMADLSVNSNHDVIATAMFVWKTADQVVGESNGVLNQKDTITLSEITLNIYGKPMGKFTKGTVTGWVELGGLTQVK